MNNEMNTKEQHLFETGIICNITHAFTGTFAQLMHMYVISHTGIKSIKEMILL